MDSNPLRSAMMLSGVVCWMVLGVSAAARDLHVEVLPGIEQNRNFDDTGHWSRQWVRSLPPENLPYLVVVRGPLSWLDESDQPGTPAGVAARNAGQLERLTLAMDEHNLVAAGDPVLLAGRVAALLRPIESDDRRVAARYARIWELWELLVDAPHADTLSIAFAAVQFLREHGITARIALYPWAEGQAFGVLVPHRMGEPDHDWTRPVDDGVLVPVALSARPIAELADADLISWSWEEVLAPGWSPITGADEPVPRDRLPAVPDVCAQARALGFECRTEDDPTLYVVSVAIMVGLTSWGVALWNRRRKRRERVAKIVKDKIGEEP